MMKPVSETPGGVPKDGGDVWFIRAYTGENPSASRRSGAHTSREVVHPRAQHAEETRHPRSGKEQYRSIHTHAGDTLRALRTAR